MELTVFVLIVVASQGTEEASTTATRAFIQQQRIDQMGDKLARRYTTAEQREAIGNAAIITKAVVERKVSVKWEF